MASAKTATLTFRIEPDLKEAVRTAAVNEHRSSSNCCATVPDPSNSLIVLHHGKAT